jgi:hypothetical protein
MGVSIVLASIITVLSIIVYATSRKENSTSLEVDFLGTMFALVSAFLLSLPHYYFCLRHEQSINENFQQSLNNQDEGHLIHF